MSDIVPHDSGIEVTARESAGFVALAARTVRLAAAALLLKAEMAKLQEHMEENARTARRSAELAGQAEVEPHFLAMIEETGRAFDQVANASGELTQAADRVEEESRAFRDAHQAEYRGIYEVNQSSPHRQPKPGFFRR
ncbi:conjugal transfer protein TraB [Kitasatospora sp. NPDC091257]|uniref:conjugal transfer protein TraB n=1 Tax=Kitasatospora sp. NPDC091257 TaxID=3364084 RepID=UPI0038258A78